MLVFEERGKPGVPREKPLGATTRANNKLNPHMTPSPGIEHGPHWLEASALTRPLRHSCSIKMFKSETGSAADQQSIPTPGMFSWIAYFILESANLVNVDIVRGIFFFAYFLIQIQIIISTAFEQNPRKFIAPCKLLLKDFWGKVPTNHRIKCYSTLGTLDRFKLCCRCLEPLKRYFERETLFMRGLSTAAISS